MALIASGGIAACSTSHGPLASTSTPPVARIISVAEWGGSAADPAHARRHVPTRITLHHGGVAFPRDKDPIQYLKNLQSWSRGDRKWIDIPYHYLIDLDGRVYAGRDIAFAGDTNTEYDPAGHALIVVMGNYEEVEPNPAQLEAVIGTMTMIAAQFAIPVEAIGGHKEYSSQTVCPGRYLDRYLRNGYFRQQVQARLATQTR